jgi:hypothetical protein
MASSVSCTTRAGPDEPRAIAATYLGSRVDALNPSDRELANETARF